MKQARKIWKEELLSFLKDLGVSINTERAANEIEESVNKLLQDQKTKLLEEVKEFIKKNGYRACSIWQDYTAVNADDLLLELTKHKVKKEKIK